MKHDGHMKLVTFNNKIHFVTASIAKPYMSNGGWWDISTSLGLASMGIKTPTMGELLSVVWLNLHSTKCIHKANAYHKLSEL